MDDEVCGGKVKDGKGKLVGCKSKDIAITWRTVPLCDRCNGIMCSLKDENDFPLKRGNEFVNKNI